LSRDSGRGRGESAYPAQFARSVLRETNSASLRHMRAMSSSRAEVLVLRLEALVRPIEISLVHLIRDSLRTSGVCRSGTGHSKGCRRWSVSTTNPTPTAQRGAPPPPSLCKSVAWKTRPHPMARNNCCRIPIFRMPGSSGARKRPLPFANPSPVRPPTSFLCRSDALSLRDKGRALRAQPPRAEVVLASPSPKRATCRHTPFRSYAKHL